MNSLTPPSRIHPFLFFLSVFPLIAPTPLLATTPGPNMCDGTKWDLPYACDLSQPYADEYRVTDGRTASDPNAPPYYSYYETVDNYNVHTLDVFYPESCLQTQDCQVFINIHGGAWQEYYKEMIDDPAVQHTSWYLTGKKGWIVVVPDYRLCDDKVYTATSCPSWPPSGGQCTDPKQAAVYPDNVNDISMIVDWVYKNAHLYGAKNSGSSEKYATNLWLMGHSAGGHLVMDWATNPSYETERHKVKGVIGLSGAYDITKLSPALADPVNDTFKAGNGRTSDQWKAYASSTINLQVAPSYPYPKFMIFDTGENDFFNLGAPSPVDPALYPDIAQEFADRMRDLGYQVTEDHQTRRADLWHIKLDPNAYGHTDEYAAITYTGSDSAPAFFEGLYLLWIDNPDCADSTHTLGPNNGDVSDNCAHFAKPAANSWLQPTDVITQWVDRLNYRCSLLLQVVPVIAAGKKN